jgi:transposase
MAVDEATAEVVAVVATSSNVSDKEVLPNLLEQITGEIEQLTGDGGYDYRSCYEAIANRKARAVIPPRRTGRLHRKEEVMKARNENLRRIKRGRKKWKKESKYHRRSLVETAMMRQKTIFGSGLSARRFNNQETEMRVRCAAMNRMTHLGMPDSYAI